MSYINQPLFVLLVAMGPVFLTAQDGFPDPEFHFDGFLQVDHDFYDVVVKTVPFDGGVFTLNFHGEEWYALSVTSFDLSGNVNTAFGDGGTLQLSDPEVLHVPVDMLLVENGDLIILSYIESQGSDFILHRISSEGELVQSFGDNGRLIHSGNAVRDVPRGMFLGEANDLYCFGLRLTETAGADQLLVKFDSGGFVDEAFGNTGEIAFNLLNQSEAFYLFTGADDTFDAGFLHDNGDLILAGTTATVLEVFGPDQFTYEMVPVITRLTQNGNLVSTFGAAGNYILPTNGWTQVYGVVPGLDGNLTMAYRVEGTAVLTSVTETGSTNSTYGSSGFLEVAEGDIDTFRLERQSDGGTLVAISSYEVESSAKVMRFFPDGSPDLGFGTNGQLDLGDYSIGESSIQALANSTDGAIYIGGSIPEGDGSNGIIGRLQSSVTTTSDVQSSIEGVSVYPVPFSTEFQVGVSTFESKELSVLVTDLAGKIVASETCLACSMLAFESSFWKPGVYVVHARIDQSFQTFKIVKQ